MRRALALVAVLAGPLLLAGCITGDGKLVGEPAPAFALATLDGRAVNLSTYAGRWLVLDLMATWCGPCKAETVHLKEVQARMGDRVAILSVGSDASEGPGDLAAFRAEYGTSWDYAADPTGAVSRAYGVRIIPKMVVVDPEGVVRFEGSGEVYPQTLARVIDPAEPAATPVLAPALAALAVGAMAALNPWGRERRARAGPAAFAVALAFAPAAAAATWLASGLVSPRATYGGALLGAYTLVAAAWWWMRRDRAEAPPRASALRDGAEIAYLAAPGLLLATALALRGTGWLAHAVPFATAAAGAALAWTAERRLRVPPVAAALALALAGAALAVVSLAGRP